MPADVNAVWERLRELMPAHDCGRQLLPGASPPDDLVLVCPPCSFVGTADPGWVASIVAQATAATTEPTDAG